jgi:hypothetical protein
LIRYLFICILGFLAISVVAQNNPIGNMANKFKGRGSSTGGGKDSLGKRKEDSITISFRFLDSARNYKLDSSVNDFSIRYPIPATHYFLGNTGTPTQSYLFSPIMKAGWDPGFHALDVYKYTIEKARFFTTTRPYSEINYLLGSKSEQYIELAHAQNIRPNWSAHFQYRLLSAPGFYKNQKGNDNNYLITNWIQTKNKRYNNYILLVANRLLNSENGGITDVSLIDNPQYTNRFRIATNLGGDSQYGTNFFSTDIPIGNKYKDFNVLMRQHYDFGKKDSLVTDSTVVPLFFPKVRVEHTIRYSKYSFLYTDNNSIDSGYYNTHYGLHYNSKTNQLNVLDAWKEIVNDVSVYTFPDSKNTQQFIKVGMSLQNLTGTFDSVRTAKYYNIFGHGEYRNRTKNQKWDLLAYGNFYFIGLNAGDYDVSASIQSLLGRKIGSLQLGFQNTNRTPAFTAKDTISAFYLMPDKISLKKENISHLFVNIYQPLLKLNLSGHYYLVNNLVYYTNYYKINQASTLFNVLQVSANKVFALGRKQQWKWRADVYFQQTIGNAPVSLPTIFTRNRIGFEGNAGYRKLDLAAGLEIKYRTNYKANDYSPVLGQFMYQDTAMVKYRLPDIAAYVQFRISSFKMFLRFENLNTIRVLNGNIGFTNNNFASSSYPYPGLLIRIGAFWGFVN